MATKRKTKKTKAPIELELQVLPIPAGALTPAAALKWLRDELLRFTILLEEAAKLKPGDAANVLLSDLAMMASTAARAALADTPIEVSRDSSSRDALRYTAELVNVEIRTLDGLANNQHALAALRRELIAGLGRAA